MPISSGGSSVCQVNLATTHENAGEFDLSVRCSLKAAALNEDILRTEGTGTVRPKAISNTKQCDVW